MNLSRQVKWVTFAAAGVLLGVAAGLAWVSLRDEGGDAQPLACIGTPLRVAKTSLPSLAGPGIQSVNGLALDAQRAVAVGAGSPEPSGRGDAAARIWVREDGIWHAIPQENLEGGAAVTITDVAASTHEWVAVGYSLGPRGATPEAWSSRDGSTWASIDSEAIATRGPTALEAVASGDGRWLIGGSAQVNGTGRAALWQSTDTSEWDEIAPVKRAGGRLPDVGITALLHEDRWIALAELAFSGTPDDNFQRTWASTDARSWSLENVYSFQDFASLNDVAEVDGELLAVSGSTIFQLAGDEWVPVASIPVTDDDADDTAIRLDAIAAGDDFIVVGGAITPGPGESDAALWEAPLEPCGVGGSNVVSPRRGNSPPP